MKYYSALNIFRFSWDQVTSAYWSRYPNPFSKHVLSEDVVEREVKDGCLWSKRLITKTNKLPKWGERFVPGSKSACIVEESVVDPVKKTLTTYTRNINLTRIMVVVEKCVYRPSKDDRHATECTKEAWVDSSIYGFSRAIQAFGVDRFRKNATRATKGLEYILLKTYEPESLPEHMTLLGNINKELKDKAQKQAARTLSKGAVIAN